LRFNSHPEQPRWTGKPYSTGFTHIALTVSDLDQIVSKLSQEGVSFPAPPQNSPDGSVKVIYAQGPEGVLLELVEVLAK
jgi:4-hydroxyphenylpyruvate dioxygenase-like putative hemolysin